VDPVPDPLLLRKFGSAGNRTQDLWISSQELLTTRPQRWSEHSHVDANQPSFQSLELSNVYIVISYCTACTMLSRIRSVAVDVVWIGIRVFCTLMQLI
jgi:hypothetical protein